MPYIVSDERDPTHPAEDAGHLNYQITLLVDDYIKRRGLRYSNINDVLGALEGAKLEFYRRIASPYEAQKCVHNGDVYSPENLTKQEETK